MFKLEDHVNFNEDIASIKSTSRLITPEPPVSDTEILVKICFDKDEGLAPEDGRYATFYNLYMVSRDWVLKDNNAALLPKRFPAFTLVEFKQLADIVKVGNYKQSTKSWFITNAQDYLMLIPISTVRKGNFKFSGVHIPKYCTNRGTFWIEAYRMSIVGTCYFGFWNSNSQRSMGSNPYQTAQDIRKYNKKAEAVHTWVSQELENLGKTLAAN